MPHYSLKEAHQIVQIQKIVFGVHETASTPISKLLESSRADWDQNRKVGDQKLENCEGGMWGFGTPLILMEKKIRSKTQKTLRILD